jgi:hypothetical protein
MGVDRWRLSAKTINAGCVTKIGSADTRREVHQIWERIPIVVQDALIQSNLSRCNAGRARVVLLVSGCGSQC